MQEFGWYFIPHECAKDGVMCNLHVAIHGCWGGKKEVIIEDEGRYWGKYAASNNFVVLFPFVSNCWDTTGETGEGWDTKNGIQPKAIMNMVDRVVQPRINSFIM
jgi:poly(3-hydroxybutyrate) depolymerase